MNGSNGAWGPWNGEDAASDSHRDGIASASPVLSPERFLEDVVAGLSAAVKSIPSRYFYDAKGSRLFEEIMLLPEYYPSRCEARILADCKDRILAAMGGEPFHVVDLGAGNGAKTRILLDHFFDRGALSGYRPVDISEDAVEALTADWASRNPLLQVDGMTDDYFSAMERLHSEVHGPRLILLLGSNVGNYFPGEAIRFLRTLRSFFSSDDAIMIGFDLRKQPQRILRAYDDSDGVTARFNLNLLERINRELEGDFDLKAFEHHALYDPLAGVARSYLVSLKRQDVRIGKAGRSFKFEAWEAIHTESSYKYSLSDTRLLAEQSGFTESDLYMDPEEDFLDALWRPASSGTL